LSAIGASGDFGCAKARQVIGQELGVEQGETANTQPRDKGGKRGL
jgi:hypothetical protein